jgi:hypothetical protein
MIAGLMTGGDHTARETDFQHSALVSMRAGNDSAYQAFRACHGYVQGERI